MEGAGFRIKGAGLGHRDLSKRMGDVRFKGLGFRVSGGLGSWV